MALTMRQVLLPEKMDFFWQLLHEGRGRAFVVNMSDLVLVPYQEVKERLVPTILGKSVPGSTFIQCLTYFYACDVAEGRKCYKLDLSTNRGLNSSPIQEQNFELTDLPKPIPGFSCRTCQSNSKAKLQPPLQTAVATGQP